MDGEGRNPVIENIKSRRSVREFDGRGVSDGIRDAIIEAGRFAPSALNRQGWKFVAISDRRLIEELSRAARARLRNIYKMLPLLKVLVKDLRDERTVNAIKKTAQSSDDTVFYSAPLVVFIANDSRARSTEKDCYIAAQNMMLAAHSFGVGSCFIGRGKVIPRRLLLEKLDVEPYYTFDACVAFGYPKGVQRTPPPRREGTVKCL
jgi:nitroreductase